MMKKISVLKVVSRICAIILGVLLLLALFGSFKEETELKIWILMIIFLTIYLFSIFLIFIFRVLKNFWNTF